MFVIVCTPVIVTNDDTCIVPPASLSTRFASVVPDTSPVKLLGAHIAVPPVVEHTKTLHNPAPVGPVVPVPPVNANIHAPVEIEKF